MPQMKMLLQKRSLGVVVNEAQLPAPLRRSAARRSPVPHDPV
jgi:hypothetical protein